MPGARQSIYLVVFDISDNRERRRIGKYLLKFGNRIQRSVFEIIIDDLYQRERMMRKLAQLTTEPEGIRLYRLCENCRRQSFNIDGDPVEVMPETIVV